MALQLVTPPANEPVTVSELKDHLRIDSGSLADALSAVQTIAPGSHAIAPGYSLVGDSVEVLGYAAVVYLAAGVCGGGGSVDVKLQESVDGVAWADVAGGAFAQVTPANDEATYELAYSGTKRYIRALATVAGAACEFGVLVVRRSPVSLEDTLLTGFIVAAREFAEGYQNRAFITQTWDLFLDEFPVWAIQVPLPPLQSVTSITYYDTAGAAHVVDPAIYQVDTAGVWGRLAPVYGQTWPTDLLRSLSGVAVRFVSGYGAAAADVPERVKTAIKLLAGHLYENREATDVKEHPEVPFAVKALLGLDRLAV